MSDRSNDGIRTQALDAALRIHARDAVTSEVLESAAQIEAYLLGATTSSNITVNVAGGAGLVAELRKLRRQGVSVRDLGLA